MRIKEAARKIDSANLGESTGFKIAENNLAFKILSDSLYSDSKTAILRELSTNAIDAHKSANNMGQPFEIKLPNIMDPTLSIKDYGIAASRDKDEEPTHFE